MNPQGSRCCTLRSGRRASLSILRCSFPVVGPQCPVRLRGAYCRSLMRRQPALRAGKAACKSGRCQLTRLRGSLTPDTGVCWVYQPTVLPRVGLFLFCEVGPDLASSAFSFRYSADPQGAHLRHKWRLPDIQVRKVRSRAFIWMNHQKLGLHKAINRHTSTQSVCLQRIQLSPTTNVMNRPTPNLSSICQSRY